MSTLSSLSTSSQKQPHSHASSSSLPATNTPLPSSDDLHKSSPQYYTSTGSSTLSPFSKAALEGMASMISNGKFFKHFDPYIVQDWKSKYFHYDLFKHEYKLMKSEQQYDILSYEQQFLEEMQRVHNFIQQILHQLESDLQSIQHMIELSQQSKAIVTKESAQRDRNIEVILRKNYTKVKQIESFYQLNYYSIFKIGKKMEKLIEINRFHHFSDLYNEPEDFNAHHSKRVDSPEYVESGKSDNSGNVHAANESQKERIEPVHYSKLSEIVTCWQESDSGMYFFSKFIQLLPKIKGMKDQCVDLYASKFRVKFKELASYELDYVKITDRRNNRTKFFIGLKVGMVLTMVSNTEYYEIVFLTNRIELPYRFGG